MEGQELEDGGRQQERAEQRSEGLPGLKGNAGLWRRGAARGGQLRRALSFSRSLCFPRGSVGGASQQNRQVTLGPAWGCAGVHHTERRAGSRVRLVITVQRKGGRAALGQRHSFEFNTPGSVLGNLILGKFLHL